jgi:radical SAM-linked protein
MQRLRIKFSRGEKIEFISHLDIIRLWERVLRRAGVPLAYSQGFSPHPQIALAVPLSVGVTSETELMDISCSRPVSPQWFTGVIKQQLPAGVDIIQVQPVSLLLPSLQSQVRFAEYAVTLNTTKSRAEAEDSIQKIMALQHLPWQHQRDTGIKSYDLRTLIDRIWLITWQADYTTIGMKLRTDNTGSGRPEQVTAALGFTGHPATHRTNLFLEAA